jgi:signal transduction histidine kinase
MSTSPAISARPRWPRPGLRVQLAALYAAVFCLACAAVGGLAEIFKPNFLVRSSCSPAPGTKGQPGQCVQGSQLSFGSTIGHDLRQNILGLVIVIVVGLFALAIGWLIAGRVVRPLRTITATARDISASGLDQRLAIEGPNDEFRQLGDTLDGLFGRLEAAFEAQRHFVANASHELRTPLAAEKTVLQVALADPDADAATLRSACETALQWNDRQESLIDALLTLASSERGIANWERFDLADLAASALLGQQQDADRRELVVDASLATAPAAGDPALAESLIANLISNAIQYNVGGGRIEVSTGVTDGRAVVTISNTGAVVAAGEVDRLIQPFQRLGTERLRQPAGHGLGLAIVSAIASVHRADFTASPRPAGGLDITVTFPEPAQMI